MFQKVKLRQRSHHIFSQSKLIEKFLQVIKFKTEFYFTLLFDHYYYVFHTVFTPNNTLRLVFT